MTAAGYRPEVIAAYQAAGGAPYLDYGDTVFGQICEGMEVVDRIAQSAVDEKQIPCGADHDQQCKPGLLRGPGGKARIKKAPAAVGSRESRNVCLRRACAG